MIASHRCKCCLQIRPVVLEHQGHRYCSLDCAEAWGEELRTRGASLLALVRLRRAEALQADHQAALLEVCAISRCANCTGLTLDEELVDGRCPACRPGTAELVIARCRAARAHLDEAAESIAAGGRRS